MIVGALVRLDYFWANIDLMGVGWVEIARTAREQA